MVVIMHMKVITGLLCLCIVCAASAQAEGVSKRGTTAAPFLQIGVGARATSLGGAFTALANDGSALYWNPAGIDVFQANEFDANYSQWIAGMKFFNAGGVLHLGGFGSVGLAVTTLATPMMEIRTIEDPEGLGTYFDAADLAIGATYAKMLTDRFSFGVTVKYIQRRIWHMTADGVAADFGAHYTLPWSPMKIGMCISNFGSKLRLQGADIQIFHDIDYTKAGNTDAVMAQLYTKEWALPLAFRFGTAIEMVRSSSHALTAVADYVHPNDNNESVNTGLEYVFEDFFSLRAGYENVFLDDSETGMTFGGGISYAGTAVQYAYVKMKHLNYVHQFSVNIQF
jgi:hypothetical protein